MAISSVTVNDLSALTSILTIDQGGTIENIVYDHTAKSLTFSEQGEYTLSPIDYIKFVAILAAFNRNIFEVFDVFPLIFPAFNVQLIDTNDGIDTLYFEFDVSTNWVYRITAIYPSGNVTIGKRSPGLTITFGEWTYLNSVSLHFNGNVLRLFSL